MYDFDFALVCYENMTEAAILELISMSLLAHASSANTGLAHAPIIYEGKITRAPRYLNGPEPQLMYYS